MKNANDKSFPPTHLIFQFIAQNELSQLDVLLKTGMDINVRYQGKEDEASFYKSTPLTFATQFNQYEIVKRLLEKKPNLDARNSKGESALWHAVANNNFDMVKLLVEHGADIQIKNRQGESLFFAVCSLKMVNLLRSLGGNIHAISFYQYHTLLTYTAFYAIRAAAPPYQTFQQAFLFYLLREGFNPYLKNRGGGIADDYLPTTFPQLKIAFRSSAVIYRSLYEEAQHIKTDINKWKRHFFFSCQLAAHHPTAENPLPRPPVL